MRRVCIASESRDDRDEHKLDCVLHARHLIKAEIALLQPTQHLLRLLAMLCIMLAVWQT